MVSRFYNTLLIADSRAVELEQIIFNQMLLSKIENCNIIVTAIRGAKIEDIVHYANTNLTASQYDLIYLLAGRFVGRLYRSYDKTKLPTLIGGNSSIPHHPMMPGKS